MCVIGPPQSNHLSVFSCFFPFFYVVKIINSRLPLIAKWLTFFQNLYFDSLVLLSQKILAASLLRNELHLFKIVKHLAYDNMHQY